MLIIKDQCEKKKERIQEQQYSNAVADQEGPDPHAKNSCNNRIAYYY